MKKIALNIEDFEEAVEMATARTIIFRLLLSCGAGYALARWVFPTGPDWWGGAFMLGGAGYIAFLIFQMTQTALEATQGQVYQLESDNATLGEALRLANADAKGAVDLLKLERERTNEARKKAKALEADAKALAARVKSLEEEGQKVSVALNQARQKAEKLAPITPQELQRLRARVELAEAKLAVAQEYVEARKLNAVRTGISHEEKQRRSALQAKAKAEFDAIFATTG